MLCKIMIQINVKTYSFQACSLQPIDHSKRHYHDVQLFCDQISDHKNTLHHQPIKHFKINFNIKRAKDQNLPQINDFWLLVQSLPRNRHGFRRLLNQTRGLS